MAQTGTAAIRIEIEGDSEGFKRAAKAASEVRRASNRVRNAERDRSRALAKFEEELSQIGIGLEMQDTTAPRGEGDTP